MTYTVTFASAHKSITSLNTLELPDFSILTGINGSGKSHFLEALAKQNIRCSATNFPNEILLYSWNNIIPNDAAEYDPLQERQRTAKVITPIQTAQTNAKDKISQLLHGFEIPLEKYFTAEGVISLLVKEEFMTLMQGRQNADENFNHYSSQVINIQNQFFNQSTQVWGATPPEVQQITITNSIIHRIFMDKQELSQQSGVLWGNINPFQQSFAKLFGTYRDLDISNATYKVFLERGETDVTHLSDDSFLKMYGRPPWEIANEIFFSAGLGFQIDKPSRTTIDPYTPILRKTSTNAVVPFSQLSSGEKVLMSFALCLFNGSDNRQTAVFPKLLLLDEIDAPLHPKMIRDLLNTIENVLVDKLGVKVILATHNPTTVALAGNQNIFRIDTAVSIIENVEKDAALNILTEGIPTLAISYEGRRQIFVESDTDAKVYSSLYNTFRPQLDSELSLTFIPVGHRDGKNNENYSGCAQVIKTVNELGSNGVTSVRGLIDWDGKREPDGEVHVLCHGRRNGIENLLLDPVLIILTLAKLDIQYCIDSLGLTKLTDYMKMKELSESDWQHSVDTVLKTVLSDSDQNGDKTSVRYANGMSLNVDRFFLEMDDHALEELIKSKLRKLKQYNELTYHITKNVIPNYLELAPSEIFETFNPLLEK